MHQTGKFGQRLLLARPQRAGQIDNGVAAHGHALRPQGQQHLQRQRAGAGTEFPQFVGTGPGQRLGQLYGQQLAENGGQFGRGHEIAARLGHLAELGAVVGVIAQARLVQRQRHEPVERQPAALLGHGVLDVRRQGAR
jgi:hypothetical protein